MVMIITGLDQVVKLISDNFALAQLGTSTATEARINTGLTKPESNTQASLTATTAKKFLQKSYTLGPTVGNGTAYGEFSIVSSTASTGTAFNRVTFNSTTKVVGESWTIANRFFVRERNR